MNARDRRRAGAGDDEFAIRAGVGADAGNRSVVHCAHEAKIRKSGRDSRGVIRVLEPRKPEAHGDRSGVGFAEPGLSQNLLDDRPHGRDRSCEIDMDIGRRADRFRQQLSIRVAQSRPRTGGAAVDAKVEGASHAVSTDFDKFTMAAAAAEARSPLRAA